MDILLINMIMITKFSNKGSLHTNLINSLHTVYVKKGRSDLIEQLPEVESQDQAYERWKNKVDSPSKVEQATEQYEQGLELENQLNFSQAMGMYESLIKEHPVFANVSCRQGCILDTTGKPSEAIDAFIRASKIDPAFTLSYFRAGILMKQVGRVEEAEVMYRKVVELNPGFAAARNNLGLLLIDKKDWEGAKEQFRVILEDFPNAKNAKRNLSLAKMKIGRGGCFIATAAIGSGSTVELNVLREFRDAYLVKSALGRMLVALYYALSPRPAQWVARHDVVRAVIRVLAIYPAVRLIRLLRKKEH